MDQSDKRAGPPPLCRVIPEAGLIERFFDPAQTQELSVWAKKHSIYPAAALLVAELARGSGLESDPVRADDEAFVSEAITGLRKTADTKGAVLGWLRWLCKEAPDSVVARIPAIRREVFETAFDLVFASRIGVKPSPADWRKARRAFANAVAAGPPSSADATVSASLWDYDANPGAVADVAATWLEATSLADAIEEVGWSYTRFAMCRDSLLAHDPKKKPKDDDGLEARSAQPTEEDFAMWARMHRHRSTIAKRRLREMREGLLSKLRATISATIAQQTLDR